MGKMAVANQILKRVWALFDCELAVSEANRRKHAEAWLEWERQAWLAELFDPRLRRCRWCWNEPGESHAMHCPVEVARKAFGLSAAQGGGGGQGT